jgi:hypothetical protein
VDHEQVKWIVLARPEEKRLLLVLASWSEKEEETQVRFSPENLGFDLARRSLKDMESGEVIVPEGQGDFKVKLPAPYGVRVLGVEP